MEGKGISFQTGSGEISAGPKPRSFSELSTGGVPCDFPFHGLVEATPEDFFPSPVLCDLEIPCLPHSFSRSHGDPKASRLQLSYLAESKTGNYLEILSTQAFPNGNLANITD